MIIEASSRGNGLAYAGKILSLSFWRDEAAVAAWRTLEPHRSAQNQGRTTIFSDDRLRIAEVARDYGHHDRHAAPADSKAVHG